MKTLLKRNYIIYFLLFLATSVSLIVSNLSYDAEYQLSMGYRLIKGDIPIIEMWEPNQTSAFIVAILMKIYISITGTTTGIVLYIHFVGYLIRVGIACFLYHVIQKKVGMIPAIMAGFIYILIGPKDILVPEYSNMEVWFSTLSVLFLIQYFEKKKFVHFIFSAVCLCLGVIAYPSFILTYFVVIFFLWKQECNQIREIFIYTGICAALGISYVLYLMGGKDIEIVINSLIAALSIEPTHTVSAMEKVWTHIKSVGTMAGSVLGICAIGFLAEWISKYINEKKTGQPYKLSKEKWMLYSWYVLMGCFLINILQVVRNGFHHFPILFIVLLGMRKQNLLQGAEKKVYQLGLTMGLATLFSTIVLSDHPFIHSTPYMMTAVVFSVIPLYRWYEELSENKTWKKMFGYGVHLCLLLVMFRGIYVHTPIQGRGQAYSIAQDMSLIRTGPAMGIITNEAGAAMQRDSYAEFQKWIQPGDTIWILGEPVDTLGYLYQDVEVGAPSVMSTPTYNNDLLFYWEINPDKYPDVVIVSSGFGTLAYEMLTNEWLMNWLEEEYQAQTVIDGNYWRYYFKETREFK